MDLTDLIALIPKSTDPDVRQDTIVLFLKLRPETEDDAKAILQKVRDAHRWRQRAAQQHTAPLIAQEPDEVDERKHLGPVWDAVQRLPKLQRHVIIAHRVKGITLADIAKFLHVHRNTVARWLADGEQAVRDANCA